MTADELARLKAWRRVNKPGSARDRSHGRHAREARRWLEAIMNETPATPTPDQIELDTLRVKLRTHLARLDAEMVEPFEDELLVGGLFD